MNHFTFQVVVRTVLVWASIAIVGGRAMADDQPKPDAAANAKPAEQKPGSAERINELIRQLGDNDYFVRQQAQDELARIGFEAFDALTDATTDDDLEIAARAKYLLRVMRVEWVAESDPPEVKRCLRNYESQDPRSREARMKTLANLPNAQGVVALCRLVRFEKSLLMSKMAAVALLSGQTADEQPRVEIVETIRKHLADCKRPGAAWLLAWVRLAGEPDAAMSEWAKLIDSEMQLLKNTPNESSPDIVAGLVRFQVAQLKKLGKNDEAMVAIRRLVELESGNPETLAALLEWLIQQKAWQAVDDLSLRFAVQFAIEPGLLYALAQSYDERGQSDRAEQWAARALSLHPGKDQQELVHHIVVANNLRQRGRFAWARREFEHVISQGAGADKGELRAMAQSLLAEMLHDQGQDLDAATMLEKLLVAVDAGRVTGLGLSGRKPNELRARMNYFFACHWESKDDTAKRREHLDKALEADPADVDVLIGCYRLPEQTPEYHAKIVELIRASAESARALIAVDAEDPTSYNQYAWLIGNTEGDFDEALEFSRKSIELRPEEGGLYDTLARVYFAKGDLDNAVKYQTKASRLEPHSGLIQRQLELFRKKQQEKSQP